MSFFFLHHTFELLNFLSHHSQFEFRFLRVVGSLAKLAGRGIVIDRVGHPLSHFFELGYLLLLLDPKFLGSESDVVSLFDTQEELSELHVLGELGVVRILFQCFSLVESVKLTGLLIRNFWVLVEPLNIFLPLDHSGDVLRVPLGNRQHIFF